MSKLHFVALLVVAVIFNACSDRFLNDQLELVESGSKTIYISEASYSQSEELNISNINDLNYTVIEYPRFIKLNKLNGQFKNGKTIVEFTSSSDVDYLKQNGIVSGLLVLNVLNYGLVVFPVQIVSDVNTEYGFGEFGISTSYLDISTDEHSSLQIQNIGSEPMGWRIASLPSWLSVDIQEGTMEPVAVQTLNFYVDRTGLAANYYSEQLEFRFTNSVTSNFWLSVKMQVSEVPVETVNIEELNGFVVSARYLKNTDQLLILTQSPNQIIVVDTKTNTHANIELPLKTSSMTISEDGKTAVVLYKVAIMETVDLTAKKRLKQYELPLVCYAAVLGGNGWCYLSSNSYSYGQNLICINLETAQSVVQNTLFNVREKSALFKIPDYKRLIAVPTDISPSHFFMGSFEKDTLDADLEQLDWSFDTGGYIWLMKNNSLFFSRWKEIFKYNSTDNTMSRFGSVDGGFSSIHWADDCVNKNLAALTVSYGYQSPAGDSWVSVWDLSSYSEVAKYYPTHLHNKTHYIYFSFFNGEGTHLYLLTRNDLDPYSTNGEWFLEIKELKE